MSLSSGVRLGPYEIVALVGAGGMGEVYRARDPRLGRDVAIKVLPPAFSADTERLRRFEQEARAAAALNHANILAVHDIGTHEGSPYIVSELLEGETLRERLNAGPLPNRKAIDYGIQLAHGLAAAHEKGIVHRDLKPENVFLATDGRVKILDFGLAKLTQVDPTPGGTTLPTAAPDTLPGLVMGTVGYMSPEQVRGQTVDHRADLFAFGAILYEMLSGGRAFRGATTADTMTAVLKEDPPDLPTAERHIPPALTRIVDRLLQKGPAARFQSAGDLAFALEALSGRSGAADAVAVTAAVPVKRRSGAAWLLAAVLGAGFVAATLAAAVLYLRPRPDERPAIRFAISPPDGWTLAVATTAATGNVSVLPLAVSPDGRRVAFVARDAASRTLLWTRALDTLVAQALAGTEGASSPFWSPDSRFVGFFADEKLKKIEVAGGPPVTLCDAPSGAGGTWSRDGVIVFAAVARPLQKVPASGGVPTTAIPYRNESAHMRPLFLPDGRHFLYRAQPLGAQPDRPSQNVRPVLHVASIDSDDRTRLLEPDSTTSCIRRGICCTCAGQR